MLPIDLTGKIAVVTGASGQLGRVLARTLARCGADVALHYFRFCRKVRFLGQNPKIGYQEFNDLQTPKLSKKQLCDRTGVRAGRHRLRR